MQSKCKNQNFQTYTPVYIILTKQHFEACSCRASASVTVAGRKAWADYFIGHHYNCFVVVMPNCPLSHYCHSARKVPGGVVEIGDLQLVNVSVFRCWFALYIAVPSIGSNKCCWFGSGCRIPSRPNG